MTTDEGLLVLSKPTGPTSFDCVARAKRILGIKRVGHCGTLDPFAEGLLLILFGKRTQEQSYWMSLPKTYTVRSQWNVWSVTGDRDSSQIETRPGPLVTEDQVFAVLPKLIGERLQTPPLYSAVKYQGKPLYAWARKGVQDVPRRPRIITVHDIRCTGWEYPFWDLSIDCGSGTYVRTLVEEIATALNTVAIVEKLVRTRVGELTLDQAITWEQFSNATRDQLIGWSIPKVGVV